MSPIIFPPMQDGDSCPIKGERPFRPRFHTELLPVLLLNEKLLRLCHRQELASLGSLDSNLFCASNGQDEAIPMAFQPRAQIQIVPIDRIGNDPGHWDVCLMDAFHHMLSQFTLRLKQDTCRNTSLLSPNAT